MWEKQKIGVRWVLHVGGTRIPSNYSGHGQSRMFSKIITFVNLFAKKGHGNIEKILPRAVAVDKVGEIKWKVQN